MVAIPLEKPSCIGINRFKKFPCRNEGFLIKMLWCLTDKTSLFLVILESILIVI